MFIEFNGKKFLWDTGGTDVFLKNARHMGVDLEGTDVVVVSHCHDDHVGGLKYLDFSEEKVLLAHPRVFREIGSEIVGNFSRVESVGVYEVFDDVYFLGEIPRITDFEGGMYGDDMMEDDSALVIRTDRGIVIIAGCSHSGIVNICEYAKKITGEEKIIGLIGGFHLLKMGGDDEIGDVQIERTLEYFSEQNIENLYPIHCVDFSVLSEMQRRFNVRKLYAGDCVEI